MINERFSVKRQDNPYVSPWSIIIRFRVSIWSFVNGTVFKLLPKPLYKYRVWLLRIFGCVIEGSPYVSASTIIKMPWNLELHNKACLGDKVEVYNLGKCILKARSTVAQHVYLCGGTHDFSKLSLPLMTGEIVIGEDAFIGAKTIILPGIHIGDGCVIGAGSVVTKDMPEWMVCAGNPCKPIKPRQFEGRGTE